MKRLGLKHCFRLETKSGSKERLIYIYIYCFDDLRGRESIVNFDRKAKGVTDKQENMHLTFTWNPSWSSPVTPPPHTHTWVSQSHLHTHVCNEWYTLTVYTHVYTLFTYTYTDSHKHSYTHDTIHFKFHQSALVNLMFIRLRCWNENTYIYCLVKY